MSQEKMLTYEPGENANMATAKANQPANGLQTNFSSPYGRYGAPRPPCSMGQIIHNQSSLVQPTQETGGTSLNIRAPIKTRSAYVYSQKQPVNSFENQQVCQSLPNMWNQNNNTYNEEQQQMENGYYTNQTPNHITKSSSKWKMVTIRTKLPIR
ncbi:hypothetical protein QE152_g4280 [Popillia japonica]|uniref:Uncharacterized protein n=1 Tax=Popillia japonica TaxID=7064 RepID=A0AAW1N2Y0_POPJA